MTEPFTAAELDEIRMRDADSRRRYSAQHQSEKDRTSLLAEVSRLMAALVDSNHWRARHSSDAAAAGAKADENWRRATDAEAAVESIAGDLATALAELCEFRSLVDDVLTVWQGYAEHQFKTATGMQRAIVADKAQTFLDLKLALEHPKTIVWPDGHPRKALAKMSPTKSK